MARSDRYPSYMSCVTDILSQSAKPLSIDTILASIAGIRPLGKGARAAVHKALRQLRQVVPVGAGRYAWLPHLLAGSVIRHTLADDEIRYGFLLLNELEHVTLFPQYLLGVPSDRRALSFDLFGGPVIRAEMSGERKTWTLNLGVDFAAWLDDAGAQGEDDVLIAVQDAEEGLYQLRLNLREMRDEALIRRRNILVALNAEEIVGEDSGGSPTMPAWMLAARLVGRGLFRDAPAPDGLQFVLHEYSMLHLRNGVNYELVPAHGPVGPDQRPANLTNAHGASSYQTHADESSAPERGELAVKRTDFEADPNQFAPEDECETYQFYLETFFAEHPGGMPVSHEDFHLLEAELEGLVNLEQDFGRLLREQKARLDYLAALLYIDPDEFLNTDWDWADGPDGAGPQFWTN